MTVRRVISFYLMDDTPRTGASRPDWVECNVEDAAFMVDTIENRPEIIAVWALSMNVDRIYAPTLSRGWRLVNGRYCEETGE